LRQDEEVQSLENREEMGWNMGKKKGLEGEFEQGEKALLQLDDVSVSFGRGIARGQRVRLHRL